MKLLQRVFAALIAAALVLVTLPQAEAASVSFADVSSDAWYCTAVTALAEWNMISGKADGCFHPNDPITRAEFVRLLAAVAEQEETPGTELVEQYTDVKASSWYAPYLSWAVGQKLISGTSDTTFSPDLPIDRQQMAVILYRFNKHVMGKQLSQGSAGQFTDVSSISSWAKKEVLAVGKSGLMNGYSDGSFGPRKNATRAEAAQILYNYLKRYGSFSKGCAISQLRCIMHGGGSMNSEYSTTNSLESLYDSLADGFTVIEVDFSWTSDGELVCAHNLSEDMTYDEFFSQFLLGFLNPLSMPRLAEFLEQNPQVRIVADIKSKNVEGLRKISAEYPRLVGQILPYVNHLSEYEEIKALGYPQMILSTYQMSGGERKQVSENLQFAKKNDLLAVALEYDGTAVTEQYLQQAKKECVPLLLATVNSNETLERYVQKGADGFFTDNRQLGSEKFSYLGF